MASPDQSPDAPCDNPQTGCTILPVVGRTREIGFPIRLTGDAGAKRLMQQRSLRFDFVAAGTSFETQGEAIDRGVAISIRARLGLLPFSAESKPARDAALALMSSPPQGARVAITGGNQIVLDGNFAVHEMVTPVSLISALAEWVVNAQPWLEAIARPLRQRAGA
jgi:hypothetical protein